MKMCLALGYPGYRKADGTCECGCCNRKDNTPMPKTTKERQEDFRARRALLEGAKEVRGIFLPEALHDELKVMAKKLSAKKPSTAGENDQNANLMRKKSP